MRMVLLQDVNSLDEKVACKGVVLTNFNDDQDRGFLLPTIGTVIPVPICILGAAPYEIRFGSVEHGKLLSPDGWATTCVISAEDCVGSTTTITSLFGAAWQISSNVPLLFE